MGRKSDGLKRKMLGNGKGYWYDIDRETGRQVRFGRFESLDEKPSPDVRAAWANWIVGKDTEKAIEAESIIESLDYDPASRCFEICIKEGLEPKEGENLEEWLRLALHHFSLLNVFVDGLQQKKQEKKRKPSDKTISHCLDLWAKHQEETKEVTRNHYTEVKRIFKEFSDYINNPLMTELNREHINTWAKHLLSVSNSTGQKTWHNKRTREVKSVFNFIIANHHGLLPDGLISWLKLLKNVKEVPKQQNKKAMPIKVFRAIYDVATDEEKLFLAISANLGLDGGDIFCLKWEDLCIDTDVPYFNKVRNKVVHRVNDPQSVFRVTPLAPTVLDLLSKHRAANKHRCKPFNLVFYSKDATPVRRNGISATIVALKTKAGISDNPKWTFKHLRNIGSNVADDMGIQREKIDAFLGHSEKTEAKKYIYSSPEKQANDFLPVVLEIEKRYFAQEQAANK